MDNHQTGTTMSVATTISMDKSHFLLLLCFGGGLFPPSFLSSSSTYSVLRPSPSKVWLFTLVFLTTIVFTNTVAGQDIIHPTTGTTTVSIAPGETRSYFDSGGEGCDLGNGNGDSEYSAEENGTVVLCPTTPNDAIRLEFLEVDVETASNSPVAGCFDELFVHNGNSTAAPLLFQGCGEDGFMNCTGGLPGDGTDCFGVEGGPCDLNGSNAANPSNNIFISTAADGCLTVRFTSDESGQEEEGWIAKVRGNDNPPVARCRNQLDIQLGENGEPVIIPADFNNGSTDDFTAPEDLLLEVDTGDAVLDCSLANIITFPQPQITLLVTDNVGQTSSCTSTIRGLLDQIPPEIICQDVTIELDPITGFNPLDTLVDAAVVSLTDNCDNVRAVISIVDLDNRPPTSVDCDDVGTSFDLFITAVDGGPSQTCQVLVTVADPGFACDEPPVARCQQNLTVDLDENGEADFVPADLDDGSSDLETPSADLTFSFDPTETPFNCNNIGLATVSLIVTDNATKADTCFTQVTFEDNIPPVVSCRDTTVAIDPATGSINVFSVSQTLFSNSDNCSISSSRRISSNGSVLYDCNDFANNVQIGVTLFSTDVDGNSASCFMSITVIDTTLACEVVPEAQCLPTLTVELDANGETDLVPADLDNGSTDDNIPMEDLVFSFDPAAELIDCDDIGTLPVTLIVTDNVGLADTCFTQVTVEDNIAPEVTCQNIAVELRANGNLSFSLNLARDVILISFTDNCADGVVGAGISGGSTSLACDQLGIVTRNFVYQDGNGNTERCNQIRVQVEDPLGVCGEDPVSTTAQRTIAASTRSFIPTKRIGRRIRTSAVAKPVSFPVRPLPPGKRG